MDKINQFASASPRRVIDASRSADAESWCEIASVLPRRGIDASRSADVESRCENVKDQLKEVLKRNGMYVGSSHAASILRELADEWDD